MPLHHPPRGFTLLELMIGVVIMSLVLFTTAQSLRTGSQVSQTTLNSALLAADAGRILHDIAMDLRSADKDFIYEIIQPSPDPDSTDRIVRFAYSTCTGFAHEQPIPAYNGQPIYDTSGKMMIEFDSRTRTLTRYTMQDFNSTTAGDDSFEGTVLATNVVDFKRDFMEQNSLGTTVLQPRIKLELTLVSNQGRPDELLTTASRTIFLRSKLFNRDGLGINDGSEGGTPVPVDEQVNMEHPSKDPAPEAIPADEQTGTNPPEPIWGTDSTTEKVPWTDPDGQTHEIDMIQLRITLRGPSVDYTVGNKTKTGKLQIAAHSIGVNLPYHNESEFEISYLMLGKGNKEVPVDRSDTSLMSDTFYIDIYGPKVGSMPVTVWGTIPDQSIDSSNFVGGYIKNTTTY